MKSDMLCNADSCIGGNVLWQSGRVRTTVCYCWKPKAEQGQGHRIAPHQSTSPSPQAQPAERLFEFGSVPPLELHPDG